MKTKVKCFSNGSIRLTTTCNSCNITISRFYKNKWSFLAWKVVNRYTCICMCRIWTSRVQALHMYIKRLIHVLIFFKISLCKFMCTFLSFLLLCSSSFEFQNSLCEFQMWEFVCFCITVFSCENQIFNTGSWDQFRCVDIACTGSLYFSVVCV